MKITDLLTEASDFHPDIRTIMSNKGYKFLGKGVDQQAYLAPDGSVMKIFGTKESQYSRGSKQLTLQQQSFIVFADYCQKHPNNTFLPKIYGWETFEFEGSLYLQINVERLFPLPDGEDGEWGMALEWVAERVHSKSSRGIRDPQEVLDSLVDDSGSTGSEVLSHFGEGILDFIQALIDLSKLSHKYGFGLDLHGGNYMVTSDGDIVISDPFHAGWSTKKPFDKNVSSAKIALDVPISSAVTVDGEMVHNEYGRFLIYKGSMRYCLDQFKKYLTGKSIGQRRMTELINLLTTATIARGDDRDMM